MLFRSGAAAAVLLLGAVFASAATDDGFLDDFLPDRASTSGKILPRGYIVEFSDDAEHHIAKQTKRSLASVNVHEEFHKYMARSLPGHREQKRSVLDSLVSAFSRVNDDSSHSDSADVRSLYTTRQEIDHAGVFRGVSVVLASDSYAHLLAKAPGVASVSPIRSYNGPKVSPMVVPKEVVDALTRRTGSAQRRDGEPADTVAPHRMTGVDRLHAEGFLGQGMVIGIIDTGESC